jgi:hypothetical protein
MRFKAHSTACFGLAFFLVCLPSSALPQPSRDKVIWNYEGGVFFATDGSIPDGPCFRIAGRINAPDFFDTLKRVDTNAGTTFRRGSEPVTHFPDQLQLSFVLHDLPCSTKLEQVGTRSYLTRPLVSSLHLSLYWKRGIALRPANGVSKAHFSVTPVTPYAADLASELPEKLEWSYEMVVPSSDVPLTDSLVLVVRTPDNRIAARVAARL